MKYLICVFEETEEEGGGRGLIEEFQIEDIEEFRRLCGKLEIGIVNEKFIEELKKL
jgi:hypothetical protein